jgi:hypothetical protein
LLLGCDVFSIYNSKKDISHYTVYGFPYDSLNDTLKLYNSYPEKYVVQLVESKNGEWVVYTKVMADGTIDLFKINKYEKVPYRLTESEGIEFDPAINNLELRHGHIILIVQVNLVSS